MIKIDSITMKEVRGIRELSLDLAGKSFVISGPNGSGKSGVVDAIEFCLTGDISRLSGRGTSGITVQRHGPHVDRRDDPASAEVTLTVQLVDLGKTAVLARNMKKPKELRITPDEPEIRAAVAGVASHPELVLSRREIIKYIVAESGERAREVQALLRLDRIGQVRSVLNTAQNKLRTAHTSSSQEMKDTLAALVRHLDVESGSPENVLASVNERRRLLGLDAMAELTEYSELDVGVETGGTEGNFNKESALRDVAALRDAVSNASETRPASIDRLLVDLNTIEADSGLMSLIQQSSFIEQGLELLDSELCPLCDTAWPDVDALRTHIQEKLSRSAAAKEIRTRVLADAAEVAKSAQELQALTAPVIALCQTEPVEGLLAMLAGWSDQLRAFALQLGKFEGVVAQRERLEHTWASVPEGLLKSLDTLALGLKAKPDQSTTTAAQTFLVRAQDRYAEYRRIRQRERRAARAHASARVVYETYCSVSEDSLSSLYEAVEGAFSEFYRELNSGDESGFKARFEQGEGKLDLSVDFYGTGMFPPGAYHSEGHQDGMGVCLYLALMERLLGDRFCFAVLDDVVMSIDRGHRKQFCRILRDRFPNTQFIITTHDSVWARQMRSEGLVTQQSSIEFQGWSLQTGPIFEPVSEVWDRLSKDLARNDVPAAAHRLRRHLEYTAAELAHELGASVPYRGDGAYELGDLFPAVVSRHKELLSKAADAANSWNDDDAREKVKELQAARVQSLDEYGGEQWVVNKAVHYNEWADFSKADFTPVVEAVRAVLGQLQCGNPACGSWLYPAPRQDPEAFRCRCGQTNVNLKKK